MGNPDPAASPLDDASRLAFIAQCVLDWGRQHARGFAWRTHATPYRVWVAAVMLQQTRLETVLSYFQRFVECYPDVPSLASSPLDTVLKAWEGLGYYARARNLHAAARLVVERHGGKLPSDSAGLRALPGVGPYVASAIQSIAFGLDAPIVDGNVTRVISRLFALDSKIPASDRRIGDLVTRLLPSGRAGAFNVAMMDLGGTVCTPRAPRCDECPLTGACEAERLRRQGEIPPRRRRPALPHYDVVAAVIRRPDGERFLVAQRPAKGLLGGLWEFPGGKQEPGESLEAALRREIREELGVEITVAGPVCTVEHTYTHFRITLHGFHACLEAGEPRPLQCAAWRWIRLSDAREFAFSKADLRVLEALRGECGTGLARPTT